MKLQINVVKGGLLMLAFMLLSNFAMAQRTVKGKITDAETSEGLIGASVSAVGTTRGTVTDIDGNFSLDVPAGATQLRVSYTGYAEQTLTLTASNVVNVAMANGTILDEVVVVGYGSVRKTDATGAVSTLTSENFNKNAIAPEQLMQGRVAGVQITQNSGEPGGGINVRIRGTTSISSGNGPLYVVDGVPLSGDETTGGSEVRGVGRQAARNPLNFLNPNDIATIDILKDASATAIYGSRGANGVVLITTKTAASGKGVLEYGYTLGAAKIAKKFDLLDGPGFIAGWQAKNPGADPKEVSRGSNTDWQDQITQTGLSHNHSLAFGSSDKTGDYRFSLGYLDQEGIIKTSGIKRLSARMNVTKKFWDDRLKLNTNVTVSSIKDRGAPITENAGFEGDLWLSALKANPTNPVREKDPVTGKDVLKQYSISEPNPVAMLELTKDFTNTLRALGSISAEIKLTGALSFKTVLGMDRSISERKVAWSKDLQASDKVFGLGRLNTNDIQAGNKLWENYFTYTKGFGKVDFTGLLGYSYQKFDYASQRFAASKFTTGNVDFMINNNAYAGVTTAVNSSSFFDELQSTFGRINLGIASKYLLTASLRADGSTKFGPDNKYGYFPSAAFKWRIIEEGFLPSIFSDLGLRLGYGVTGNQAIGHNQFDDRERANDHILNDGGNQEGGGTGVVSVGNPKIKWETTTQSNLGLDWAIMNYRISGSIDLYQKNTKDLLLKVPTAAPNAQQFNTANQDINIENRGVELNFNVVAVDQKMFDWRILPNVSFNKNTIKKYAGSLNTGEINGQGLSRAYAQRISEGHSLFEFFVREFDGYDDNGVSKYKGGDAQRFLGKSPIPKISGGLTNEFKYGNLDLSLFFYGQFGHYVYNNTANALFTAGALGGGRNVTSDVATSAESRLNAPDPSTRFLEKGDFVRLQDLTIGYNIKPANKKISNIRVFLSGQNLALFTDYSGLDPEVNTNKTLDNVPSLGIDYSAYPRARNLSVGANISF